MAVLPVVDAIVVPWLLAQPVSPGTTAPDPPFLLFPIVLVPVGLLVMFPLVSTVIASLGRWGRLAERFPAVAIDDLEESFEMQSALVGGLANYKASMRLRVGARGLWMRPMFPFSFGHPPIEIPWGEVARCEPVKLFLRTGVEVEPKGDVPTIRFFGSGGDAILRRWQAFERSRRAR